MPYTRLYYHIVWATKERHPLIEPRFEAELYSVIVQKAKEMGAIVYAVGGIEDHIHLAASVPPKIPLANFIGQVKGNSSHFINLVIKPGYHFKWQEEYGVHTFSERGLPRVVAYIKNQRKHHSQGKLFSQLERDL